MNTAHQFLHVAISINRDDLVATLEEVADMLRIPADPTNVGECGILDNPDGRASATWIATRR